MDRDARATSHNSLESNEYYPKCIVAEAWDPDLGAMMYLIEWEDYDFHDCTWEPTDNLSKTRLLEDWVDVKARLGCREFKELIERNIHKWWESNGSPEEEGDGVCVNEEDVPLMLSRTTNPQHDRGTNSNSLFVNDQDASPRGSPPDPSNLSTRTSGARRNPFAQSPKDGASFTSSSLSDSDHDSRDSLLEEIADGEKSKKSTGGTTALATESRKGPELGNSILSSHSSNTVPKSPKATPGAANVIVSELGNQGQQPTSSKTVTDTVNAAGSKSTKPQHVSSRANDAIGHRNHATTTIAAAQPTTNSSTYRHPRISGRPGVKRMGPASKAANSIKMTNEPVVTQRKPWNTEGMYNTLKYRNNAEKRSRQEGIPDFESLDFVGSRPTNLGKRKSRDTEDNPYGRREAGHRRVQEVDTDEIARKDTVEQAVPLQKWETDKAPLVCPQWRLSNNCQYSAETCIFLHRHKDAEGEVLPIADINGFIPQKYRKPPLTCPFWLQGESGCRKSDAVCSFAHKNTGWLPGNSPGAPQIQVDKNMTPISEQRNDHPRKVSLIDHKLKTTSDQHVNRPSNITRQDGYCRKSDADCKYQHRDTGVIAHAPICRFFLEGNCRFAADTCKSSHGPPDELKKTQHSSNITPQGARPQSSVMQIPNFSHYAALGAHDQRNIPSTVGEEEAPPTSVSIPEMMQRAAISTPMALPPPANSPCLSMKQRIEHALKIKFKDMFNWGNDVILDRKAFLLFHPVDHAEELELLTRWLLMHHVDISNPWFQGGWEHFTEQLANGGSGVVIVHPDFESFFELSALGQLLRKQVRVWSLGVQLYSEHNPAAFDCPPDTRHDCIEIFPLGGLIYITDHVFEEQPQLALQIVELYLAKINDLHKITVSDSSWQDVSDLNLYWRLCVRPELMQYLYERCEEQSEALEAGELRASARARLYNLLSDPKLIEQDGPVQTLDARPDKFPIMSERRDFAQEEPLDYFNALARSREKAHLRMVRYYGGLHIDMRRTYRHFYVVHTDASGACALQWKREIQTLTNVITPKQCVVELKAQGDEMGQKPMFDFYEKKKKKSSSFE